MSEQDLFEAWWQTLNVYDPTLKALAGSAWMEAIRASKPIPPDPHIALMEAEHDDRMPRPEDPDEWVIQDMVIPRNHVDQWKWVGHDERANDVSWSSTQGNFTRYKHGDEAHGETLHVRCRRRDLPRIEPTQCISHDEHRGEWRCPNPALPGKDHCSECADDEPQPQKTRVRLWMRNDLRGRPSVFVSDRNPYPGSSKYIEIHHDAEGFYVEGRQS